MTRINFDHANATPLAPEAKQAMGDWLERAGNPSSLHTAGREAKQAVDTARGHVARLIGAQADEIYFTSCGTESNNWAIKGLLAANRRKGNHVVVSTIEHPSVLLTVRRLEKEGWNVSYLPVTREGVVEPDQLKQALTPSTALVSIMHANGEIGTLEPIAQLARIAKDAGALFHTDAVASTGLVPIDVRAFGVDALSLAANTFGGPFGAAALYVREGLRILPLFEGGGQETGARSGSEALLPIVGMGAAAEAASRAMSQRAATTQRLRDRLKAGIIERVAGVRVNGSWDARLPQHVHVCLDGIGSESLLLGLDQAGIAVGLGSACNSKAMRPSHVLTAIGLSDDEASGAMVLTLGPSTTDADVDAMLERLPAVVERLRHVTAATAR